MTSTKTTTMTKTNHSYFGVLAVLAMMMAAMLLMASGPAHASSAPFTVNTRGDEGDAFLGDGICDVGIGPGGSAR